MTGAPMAQVSRMARKCEGLRRAGVGGARVVCKKDAVRTAAKSDMEREKSEIKPNSESLPLTFLHSLFTLPKPMHGKFAGYKTYIVCGLAILTAWGTYLMGDYQFHDAVEASFAALTAAAIRHGIGGAPKVKAFPGQRNGAGMVAMLAFCVGFAALLPSCSGPGGNGTGGSNKMGRAKIEE